MNVNWRNPFRTFAFDLISLQYTELIAVGLLVVYSLTFAFGMRKKRRKLAVLKEIIMPALQSQFYSVEETFSDSLSELACYGSGRRNCRSVLARIQLRNSHDFLSLLLLDQLFQNEDRMLISIDFLPRDNPCPLVYCVVHSKFSRSFLASAPDVRAFCKTMSVAFLPESLVCMTENRECVLLTPRIVQAIRRCEDIFRYLHISDQIDVTDLDPPDREIRLCTSLPKSQKQTESLEELIISTCELVDVLVSNSVFPSDDAKDVALAARMRVRVALNREDYSKKVN